MAAAFLCANKPKKTTGADIYDGTTIDQIIARKIGQETLLPSLQLALEDPGANSSNCGEGYSCTYSNTISWATPTQPLPMELDPQVAFERLFGSGGTPAERAARRDQDRSILDSVTENLARFKQDLGAGDRARLDEYETDIRELERRLEVAKKAVGKVSTDGVVVPAGVPESFDEHVKLHFDLQTLAFQADITRVSTVLYARDLTGAILSRKRRHRRIPRLVASRRKSGHHRELRKAQPVSRQVPGLFHRQTEQDSRWRWHFAGPFADSIRQQHGRLQPASSLRCAAPADRRRFRPAKRQPSSCVSHQDGNQRESVVEHSRNVRHSTGRDRR